MLEKDLICLLVRKQNKSYSFVYFIMPLALDISWLWTCPIKFSSEKLSGMGFVFALALQNPLAWKLLSTVIPYELK